MVDNLPRSPRCSKPRFNPTRLAEASVVCITAAVLLALILPGNINGVPTAQGPLYEVVIPVAITISITATAIFAIASALAVQKRRSLPSAVAAIWPVFSLPFACFAGNHGNDYLADGLPPGPLPRTIKDSTLTRLSRNRRELKHGCLGYCH